MSMLTSLEPSGPWRRAAVHSVVWLATAPARRLWLAAEVVVSRLVSPRALESPDEVDARAISVVESSELLRIVDRALTIATAAWRDSVAGAVCGRVVEPLKSRTAAGRVRLAGGVTALASATALVVQRLSTRPEPLTAIVPVLFLCLGAGLFAAARERSAR